MDLIHPAIAEYMRSVSPIEDPVLQAMERYAQENNFPIIGPLVGQFLYQMVKVTRADRILELGSGYGYSAYWMAKAMGKEGEIICTEYSDKNITRAKAFLKQGGVGDRVRFYQGDALELLETFPGSFNIILNDIDKKQYPQVPPKVLPRLQPGGLLITDNILWKGRVLDDSPDESTAGIIQYTRMVTTEENLVTTIIPLRDGIAVTVKLR